MRLSKAQQPFQPIGVGLENTGNHSPKRVALMRMVRFHFFVLLVFLYSVAAAFATCSPGPCYVDPNWGGTLSGTQSLPYATLTAGAWTDINNALALGDVTVYFSARLAGADTDSFNGGLATIDLTKRTDGSSHVLTFDGSSFYNTSEVSPSWSAYATACSPSSNACARVFSFSSQNISHLKYSNITIRGFHILVNSVKAIAICGDNQTIVGNNIESSAGATAGPTILLVPTADGQRNGSSSYCPVSDTIAIGTVALPNYIHDTFSEAIYLGGGGCNINNTLAYSGGSGATFDVTAVNGMAYTGTLNNPGTGYSALQALWIQAKSDKTLGTPWSGSNAFIFQVQVLTVDGSGAITSIGTPSGTAGTTQSYTGIAAISMCDGFPAHTNVNVTGNYIYNTSTQSGSGIGQGDGIDVKGGLVNLTISQNTIYNLTDPTDQAINAIVLEGQMAGVANSNILIERNYIHDIKVQSAGITTSNSWGIPDDITLRNNVVSTIYFTHVGKTAECFRNAGGTNIKIYNNTFYNCTSFAINNSGASTTATGNISLSNNSGAAQISGSMTASFNGYGGTWSGTCTSCVPGFATSDMVNPGGGNFTLVSGSKARNAGTAIAGFANDIIGTARPQELIWDIGAYEYIPPNPSITSQPSNQTVSVGQTATFGFTATGTPSPTYQWRTPAGGANIMGATSTSYTTPATVLGDNGTTFDVVVTNSAGTIISNAVTLSVNSTPIAAEAARRRLHR